MLDFVTVQVDEIESEWIQWHVRLIQGSEVLCVMDGEKTLGFIQKTLSHGFNFIVFSGMPGVTIGEFLVEYFRQQTSIAAQNEKCSVCVHIAKDDMDGLSSTLATIGFKMTMMGSASYGQGEYYTDLGHSVILSRDCVPEDKKDSFLTRVCKAFFG